MKSRRRFNERTHTFQDIIALFRQEAVRSDNTGQSNASSHAATLQDKPLEQPSSSSSNKPQRPVPTCVCGTKHWFRECHYLNESTRPKGWRSDQKTSEKVAEALKSPDFKRKVDSALEKSRQYKAKNDKDSENKTPERVNAFAAASHTGVTSASYSGLTQSDYTIANCYVLNSGSDIHLCNNPSRFQKTRSATADDILIAGKTTYQIDAYGSVPINFTNPDGRKQQITLLDVALVPGFFDKPGFIQQGAKGRRPLGYRKGHPLHH